MFKLSNQRENVIIVKKLQHTFQHTWLQPQSIKSHSFKF